MTLAQLYEQVKQNATSAYGRPILDEGYSMYDLSRLDPDSGFKSPDDILREGGYRSKKWMEGSWANTPAAADFGGNLRKMAEFNSPGGQWINDPNFGEVYQMNPNVPQQDFGHGQDNDWMANLVLAGILGVGGAGMMGLLPGTTPAFGAAAAGGSTAALPESYWSALADAGGVASDAAAVGAGTVGGGVDYSLASGLAGKGIGGAPAGLGITPSSSFGVGLGAAAPASSLASNLGAGIGSGVGSGLVNLSMNPSGLTPSGGGAPVQEGPTTPTGGPGGTTIGEGHTTPPGDFRIEDILPGGKYANLTGSALATVLGLVGSSQQADAYKDISDKYFAMGAPSRARLEASYAPGFSMADQPDFMNALDLGAKAAASATAAKYGNPVDNPGAYAEMQKYISGSLALPQLNTHRSQLGTFGQLGTNMAGTADMNAANAGGNTFNVLGAGVNDVFNPRKSTLEQLAEFMKLKIG